MRDIQSLPTSVEELMREASLTREKYSEACRHGSIEGASRYAEDLKLIQHQTAKILAQQHPELAAAVFAIQVGERGIEAKEVEQEEFISEREVNVLGVRLGKRYVPETKTKTTTRTYKMI